jgi:hypothetical protein
MIQIVETIALTWLCFQNFKMTESENFELYEMTQCQYVAFSSVCYILYL